MKSIDRLIAKLKMRSSDEQVAIMRALAADNGYLVVAGYSITGIDPTRGEIVQLRTALQNCRMFFDANNRPNYVAMIDEAMGNEQKVDETKNST